MTSNKSQDVNNEAQIRALIERWAKAVREENSAAIRMDHHSDILMFDVPPPFLSRGLDAYMATWETFFSSVEKPVTFDFHDVQITCGSEVAFATADDHYVIGLSRLHTSGVWRRLDRNRTGDRGRRCCVLYDVKSRKHASLRSELVVILIRDVVQ
jgi:ketosteroid isomerase-like protein